MSLWWLQPGWTDAICHCGKKIWPEGDPDWGECFECFTESLNRKKREEEEQRAYEQYLEENRND